MMRWVEHVIGSRYNLAAVFATAPPVLPNSAVSKKFVQMGRSFHQSVNILLSVFAWEAVFMALAYEPFFFISHTLHSCCRYSVHHKAMTGQVSAVYDVYTPPSSEHFSCFPANTSGACSACLLQLSTQHYPSSARTLPSLSPQFIPPFTRCWRHHKKKDTEGEFVSSWLLVVTVWHSELSVHRSINIGSGFVLAPAPDCLLFGLQEELAWRARSLPCCPRSICKWMDRFDSMPMIVFFLPLHIF